MLPLECILVKSKLLIKKKLHAGLLLLEANQQFCLVLRGSLWSSFLTQKEGKIGLPIMSS
jgi:hypothetical protein